MNRSEKKNKSRDILTLSKLEGKIQKHKDDKIQGVMTWEILRYVEKCNNLLDQENDKEYRWLKNERTE